jgi:endonuclease/exonuclease/phosphatase family metal-dependent hydrolase
VATPIRVLTYNVRLLPSIAKLWLGPYLRPRGFWEEHMEDEVRVVRIAHEVLCAPRPWDIVVFQEAFRDSARRRLRQLLAKRYRYFVEAPRDTGFFDTFNDDSGFLIASRFPIGPYVFEEFRRKTGSNMLVDKGVVTVSVDLSARVPGRMLQLFVVHLQSEVANRTHRRSQVSQLRDFVGRTLAKSTCPADTLALVCGDFNVIGETDEHVDLLRVLGGRDLYRESRPAEPGYTWDATRNTVMIPAGDGRHERLDYAIAFDRQPGGGPSLRRLACVQAEIVPFEIGAGHCLSDHFGVEVDLHLG